MFTVAPPLNPQNDQVYALTATKKSKIKMNMKMCRDVWKMWL